MGVGLSLSLRTVLMRGQAEEYPKNPTAYLRVAKNKKNLWVFNHKSLGKNKKIYGV